MSERSYCSRVFTGLMLVIVGSVRVVVVTVIFLLFFVFAFLLRFFLLD